VALNIVVVRQPTGIEGALDCLGCWWPPKAIVGI